MIRLLGVLLMVLSLYVVQMGFSVYEQIVQDGQINTQLIIDQHQNLARRAGLYGIMTVGVGMLIISGGIDLSIGSVVALGAVTFGLLLKAHVPPWIAALIVILGSGGLGLIHGLLVTRLNLPPFLVTLCGLFIYRGIARCLSTSTSVGLNIDASPEYLDNLKWFRSMMVGEPFGISQQFVILILLAILLGLFLHFTRHGRYLFAIGANEEAARYAGISTANYKVMAYIICSSMVGLASVLEILESRVAQATQTGQLYELFAITGAVLGGCSLVGGEGTMPGMVLGAAVLPLLRQVTASLMLPVAEWLKQRSGVDLTYIVNELEYVVIGLALLLGTIADQYLRRRGNRRASG